MYKIGDIIRNVNSGDYFMLTQVHWSIVGMIYINNNRNGEIYSIGTEVKDIYAITKKEFDDIVGGFGFIKVNKFLDIVDSMWYHHIPDAGVLCWVSDEVDNPDFNCRNIGLVTAYNKTSMMFDCNTLYWKYATPLTKEEIEQYLGV